MTTTLRGCLVVAWLLPLSVSCAPNPDRSQLPFGPSASSPPPVYVPPPPRQFPPFEITTIAVGDVISRTNLDAPECIGFDRWPCLYFRVVAPSTGTLEVTLTYAYGTQGNQGVDVSLREAGTSAERWAQTSGTTALQQWYTTLTALVVEGKTYDITLWYTLPNLEYELRTALRQ